MTKAEIIALVKETVEAGTGVKVTNVKAGEIVETIFGAITSTLKEGTEVTLPGLGKLKVQETAERTGVSKLGGVEKEWHKPAGRKVKFAPSKSFKESL